MRRRLILGVVAAIAASVWVAPAANAQVTMCLRSRLPAQTIVDVGTGRIDIYPQNVGPYAGTVVDWAADVATCIVDETAGPLIACADAYVQNRPTVTIDPQTLQITIEYGQFLGTACQLG